jgi:phage terminase large subunit
MEITTKHNKNFMRTFTIDDPSKAKSIKDPSHIWMEEADQFTEKDFGLLLSRLRTEKVKKTQLVLTTNTERMHNSHWIVTQISNNSKKI